MGYLKRNLGYIDELIELGASLNTLKKSDYKLLLVVQELCHQQQWMFENPESVHVDQIYRTRENRNWCKERGIRMSGPRLGRPPNNISLAEKKQAQIDERIRNGIEGKFGQGKRRFGLNLIMTKLPNTSETAIALTFLVMNLNTLLRRRSYLLFCLFWKKRAFSRLKSMTICLIIDFNQFNKGIFYGVRFDCVLIDGLLTDG